MKNSGILVWDCAACQSKGTEFIQKLQKMTKVAMTRIIVASSDPQAIPASVSDLSISLPVTTRFGPNAFRDALVDVIHHLSEAKNKCSVYIMGNSFPLWISLFQRIEPRSVVFISGKDPRECLDFSFLPPSLPVTILNWPNLDAVTTTRDEPQLTKNSFIQHEISASQQSSSLLPEEEDAADAYEEDTQTSPGEFTGTIQPLSNLDKYQIDLRSPISGTPTRHSESGDSTPKRAGSDQVLEVPKRFRPLIEAMKSMGKAMISLSDLEGQLKIWSTKLNEPVDNINAYITKAADAQLVIYDKSINYVRFRNRSMANAAIEYV